MTEKVAGAAGVSSTVGDCGIADDETDPFGRYPAWKAGCFSLDHFSITGGGEGLRLLVGADGKTAAAEAGFSSAIVLSEKVMTSSSSVFRSCRTAFSGSA